MFDKQADPYSAISIDTARFDPQFAQQLFISISNALTDMYRLSNDNRQKLIKFGAKPTKNSTPEQNAEYDGINAERYDIDSKIDGLKVKWNTVSQILYWQANEVRHWAKSPI